MKENVQKHKNKIMNKTYQIFFMKKVLNNLIQIKIKILRVIIYGMILKSKNQINNEFLNYNFLFKKK